jgi:hypothetical protein
MLAPLFIWFAPDMTRRELTDFVGEKVAQAAPRPAAIARKSDEAQSIHLVGARRIITLLLWASYKRPAIVTKSESRLRMYATVARDAALTVPTAPTSASFDLSIMVFLPLSGRSGA